MSLFSDVATLLVDPTGTLLATTKAAETTAEAIEDRQQAPGKPAPPVDKPGTPTPVTQCCKEFELRDGFLLNTRTGAVWQYDKQENKFKYVERVDSEISKAAWGILGNHLIDELLKQEAKAAISVHHSVAGEYKKNVDSMVKTLRTRMR